MKINNIAFASLKKQKGKSFFLFLVMFIGCTIVLSLYTFIESKKKMMDKQFDEYGSNIIVMPKSDSLPLNYGGVSVSPVVANIQKLTVKDIKKIKKIPYKANIRVVSPKYLTTAIVKNGEVSKKVLIVGIHFTDEFKMKTWWKINGKKPSSNNELVVGSEAAKKLKLQLNSKILIGKHNFRVASILNDTGSQDDHVIFAEFNTVNTYFKGNGRVSLAEVSALCGECPIGDIVKQISATLPNASVKSIKKVMKQKMDTIKQFERFSLLLTVLLIATMIALIFGSVTGAVAAKKKELGIFRAIGFKKQNIMNIILLENSAISITAGISSCIISVLSALLLLPQFAGIPGEFISLNPLLFTGTFLGMILTGILGALYPAYKASQVDPVLALNSF